MRILFKNVHSTKDGVYSYIENLINVLADNGHQCYYHGEECYIKGGVYEQNFRPFAYDIVFGKEVSPNPTVLTITHLHNANIPNSLKDMIKIKSNATNMAFTMNSEYQKLQLDEYGINTEDMHILPNVVDESVYVPSTIEKKKDSIIYFGSITGYNRNTILTLIRAMRHLPYTLTMVGRTGQDMLAEINAEKPDNVYIHGVARSNTEKIYLLQTHTIGVGVGRALMEMVLCGLPVMLFGLGYNGYVKESDLGELQRANYTTRMMPEISEEEKIASIIDEIKNPTYIDRACAEEWFGLRKNIKAYTDLFASLNQEWLAATVAALQ